jgi:hypothetical protein
MWTCDDLVAVRLTGRRRWAGVGYALAAAAAAADTSSNALRICQVAIV